MRITAFKLTLGPVMGGIVFFLLGDHYTDLDQNLVLFSFAGRVTAGLATWMALWWMTEAIPIPATALLPLVILPTFTALPIQEVAVSYGHELIFLFMGGFILALSMQRWNLHRRIAFITLGIVGSSAHAVVVGFMIVTATLSMWVSNTATSLMMLPIALSIIDVFDSKSFETKNFSLCLLLGIAYSASIGGIGTLIGTPPNIFLASFVKNQLNFEITFARWMMVGIPLVILMLPFVYLLLTHFLFPLEKRSIKEAKELTTQELKKCGPMSRGEWATFLVFIGTALTWSFRPILVQWTVGSFKPLAGLTDAGVAMTAALILFLIPVNLKEKEFVMNWGEASKLPWGLLILFGGGLSLARSIKTTGVGEYIASHVSGLSTWPPFFIVFFVTFLLVFLTELTSNTATTATLVPLLASMAMGFGVHPFYLIVPAAIGASCAFMLPVATPPNAIIFGSGRVRIPEMSRAGIGLNIFGIILISIFTYFLAVPFFLGI